MMETVLDQTASLPAELLRQWDTEKNGAPPAGLTRGSTRKAWWRCEKGHSWQAVVYSRTGSMNRGCPYCSGQLPLPGESDLATVAPDAAKLWDAEKNAALTPRDVTAGSKTKAWWRCEKGHSWQASVYSLTIVGSGCPYCSGKRAIPGETDLLTKFPFLADEWCAERNGALSPGTVAPTSDTKVWWRCDKGHEYQTSPYCRTQGCGCPYCAGKKVLAGFNDLATLYPDLANQWYAPLNGDLTPQEVTKGSHAKVWWQCSEGHVWQSMVFSRTRARSADCPVCAGKVRARRGTRPEPRRSPAVYDRALAL